MRLHSSIFALLASATLLAHAQSITSTQQPFPDFSLWDRCGLSQTISANTNSFFGQCVNPFTGEIDAWGENIVSGIPDGSYYSVASGQGQFGSWGCGISRNDFGVECWGGNFFTGNVPTGLKAWRISGGDDFVCALTFNPDLYDEVHNTMKNPTGHVEFWESFGIQCWGFESQVGEFSNLNFPFINDPANEDPVVGIATSQTSTCIFTAKGSISCGGTFSDPIVGSADVNSFVNNGVAYLSLQAGVGLYCGATSATGITCWGDACDANPALCFAFGVSIDTSFLAIAPSANTACYLTPAGEVECWVNDGIVFPEGPFTELYKAKDLYCAVREENNEVVCFGLGSPSSPAFSPPASIYQLGCLPTEPTTVNGIALVSTAVNPYVCQIEGDFVNARFEWDVSSQCICYAASIDSVYLIPDGGATSCGLSANTFHPKPINPSDVNCIA